MDQAPRCGVDDVRNVSETKIRFCGHENKPFGSRSKDRFQVVAKFIAVHFVRIDLEPSV